MRRSLPTRCRKSRHQRFHRRRRPNRITRLPDRLSLCLPGTTCRAMVSTEQAPSMAVLAIWRVQGASMVGTAPRTRTTTRLRMR